MIYRLLHYYQNYVFVRRYLTTIYNLDYDGLENKTNKQVTLKNWYKKLN